jgi:hypothetical protein
MNFIDWFLNNLAQQSTWKGIIGIATAAGLAVAPELQGYIVSAGLGLIGAINFFRNEKKGKK